MSARQFHIGRLRKFLREHDPEIWAELDAATVARALEVLNARYGVDVAPYAPPKAAVDDLIAAGTAWLAGRG